MREYQNVAIDLVDESTTTNPRRVFRDDADQELAASIREDGVIQPIVVSRVGDRFIVRAGARRLRAGRIAGLSTIPARVLDVDETKAERIALIENIQRSALEALDEAYAYKRFLDQGRTLDELAATVQKSKRYVHEQLRLLDLIREAQDLLSKDILPIEYARLLARVPAERQPDGLAHCFCPLFQQEGRSRDQLEPLAKLRTWMEKSVRLDPRSSDTKVLLPDLADHVAQIEAEKGASILALSTLHNHAPGDRNGSTDKPILARSWVASEGKDACKYARPGVIVLGPGQNDRLNVCIEKTRCTKHWLQPKAEAKAASAEEQARHEKARRAQEEKRAKEEEAARKWDAELRPRALKLVAERTATLRWTPALLGKVLGSVEELREFLPPLDKLPVARYPQAVALALAQRASWRRESLFDLVNTLGIRLTAKDLNGTSEDAPTAKPGPSKVSSTSPRKKARR